MSSHGITSSKKANDSPGLCPIKRQKYGLCSWIGARNQFLSLSLSTTRTTPHYKMLVFKPALYLSFNNLPRDSQEWLRTYKRFASLYSSMFRDPIRSHYVPGSGIIQCLLALSLNGVIFGSLKSFQSCLIIRSHTDVFPWPSIHLNYL